MGNGEGWSAAGFSNPLGLVLGVLIVARELEWRVQLRHYTATLQGAVGNFQIHQYIATSQGANETFQIIITPPNWKGAVDQKKGGVPQDSTPQKITALR